MKREVEESLELLETCYGVLPAARKPAADIVRAHIRRLEKLVSVAVSDYIGPEIRHEQEAFKGHEHCSNLDGLRGDLAEFQSAIAP